MPESAAVPGLTNPRCLELGRASIRTREGSFTQSAWRLRVGCEEGEGMITLVEVSSAGALYRGDGVFLGWSQERLEAAYRALSPEDDEPGFEPSQLG
ncbi:MAG TPA: hypothetical protein VGL03_10720 [Thermoanaerobaculia bacterium]